MLEWFKQQDVVEWVFAAGIVYLAVAGGTESVAIALGAMVMYIKGKTGGSSA